jgi:hypothetical protein
VKGSVCYPDQHLQSAVQGNLLMSVKGSGSEATSAANNGTDAGSFAASEDAAEQRAGPRTYRGVN